MSLSKKIVILTFLITIFSLVGCGALNNPSIVEINDNWEYRLGFDESQLNEKPEHGWEKISLPFSENSSSYNFYNYTGWIWLRKKVPDELVSSKVKQQQIPQAILLGNISDVARLYINSTPVAALGSIQPYKSATGDILVADLPGYALAANQDNYINLAIYSDGDLPYRVTGPHQIMGAAASVYRYHYSEQFIYLLLLLGYLAGGAYHLFLYSRRRNDIYNLYLSLFSFLLCGFWFLHSLPGETLLKNQAELRRTLSSVMLYWLTPIFIQFVTQFLKKESGRFISLLALITAALSLLNIFGNYKVDLIMQRIWEVVTICGLFYLIYYTWREFQLRYSRIAIAISTSIVILLTGAANDLVTDIGLLSTPYVTKYTLLVLILLLSTLMVNQLMTIYRNYELLTRNLEKQVENRTIDLKKAIASAEDANQQKSRFLANMSHEMRTPLNSIIGYTEYILENEPHLKNRDIMEIVKRGGETLATLINDILDFSKIESGEITLLNEPFSLRDEVNAIMDTMALSARSKNLRFDCKIDDEVRQNFVGDAVRIKQILLNLLGNAIKFTTSGFVELKITVAKPKVNHINQQLVEFHVVDSGIGIPESKQSIVFEAFRQADETTTREFGGSGLGLSIVRYLVDLMQGDLGVKSPIEKPAGLNLGGEGSDVWFILPLEITKERDKNLDDISDGRNRTMTEQKKKKIMVAEDNPDNQVLIKLILERMGHSVEIAVNGDEAVQKALSGDYDLIFMDIHMPIKSGYEATAEIRSKESKRIPIIALTADAFQEDINRCLDAGMDGHLSKPLNKNKIFEIIESYQ